MRRIGQTRIKLAEQLSMLFNTQVYAEDLWMQEGGYRSKHWDLAKWGGHSFDNKIIFWSWDTMTECIRKNIIHSHYYRDLPNHFEIHAK